ncbi:hypothetical protein BCR35DRAFT_356247 [Leucosporidium creatinivorum]|uniref:BTB domain-containing protein n=1 Tax=Leucosporidium creatinivorum TaxID=106004 RepID=A0A1Y2CIP7_9BASI|nr:hypothetical protein BCR35DRAFT_356247 [Leucosporidium creatinivorum]
MSGQPPAAPPTTSHRTISRSGSRLRPAPTHAAAQASGQPAAANGAPARASTLSGSATGSLPGPTPTTGQRPTGSPFGPFSTALSSARRGAATGSAQRSSSTSRRRSDDSRRVSFGRSPQVIDSPRQEAPKKDHTADFARRTAALRRSRNALDVRLVFPRASGHDLELWSNSALLKDASSYFTTLLESDFAETFTASISKRRRIDDSALQASSSKGKEKESDATSERVVEPREFEDSDDEADEAIAHHFPEPTNDDSSTPYHEVVLPQACYTTFETVLAYITTGYVDFAPLSATRSAEKRSSSRAKHLADKPFLPLRASPKSVYRLAHLLELPDLAALALAEIERQLTAESVAAVLFSDVSLCYDAVKDLALEYAVRKWSEVQKSAGMHEVQKQVESNKAPEYGKLAFELLMKVGKEQPSGQSAQPDSRGAVQSDSRRTGVGFDSSSDEEELVIPSASACRRLRQSGQV